MSIRRRTAMIRILWVLLALLAATFTLTSRSEARPPPTGGRIEGLVVMEGSDMVYAPVALTNSSGGLVASTFSMSSGYALFNIAPGNYTITAFGDYGNASASVAILAGQVTYQDLTVPGPDFPPIFW
jgi:hypothetical protein